MKLEVTKKINATTEVKAEFEGKMGDVLKGANALLAFTGECGLCGKTNCSLQTKIAKGYQFIEFVCLDCGARASWGQYKEGGYFLKKFEQYQPTQEQAPESQEDAPIDESQVPF